MARHLPGWTGLRSRPGSGYRGNQHPDRRFCYARLSERAVAHCIGLLRAVGPGSRGLRLTAGDVERLEALRNEIAASRHAFPDLLARAQALAAQAESIVAAEARPLPGAAEARMQAIERERRLNELLLRRQELELQMESRRLVRQRRVGAGWITFGAGVAGGGLAGLFAYLGGEAYQEYLAAATWEEAQRKEAQVRLWDVCTIGALGAGGACLVVSSLLWASGPSSRPLRKEIEAIDGEVSGLRAGAREGQVLVPAGAVDLQHDVPVVAGLEPQVAVQVTDDAPRLFAEGYVKGLQNRVMDLVARRELYTARFRRHIQQKQFDQAKTLLETFRGLENRSDLARQLDQQAQRVKSSDRRVQAKIDQLFTDTRQLLLKFLDPRTSNQLADELLRAQRPG